MHLVGFIIRIYHDARSLELQELALVTGDCYVCGTDPLIMQQLSVFISVFNQLDAQNLFHNKFYFMPLHVSSTCARNM